MRLESFRHRSGSRAAGNVVERIAEIVVLGEDLRQCNLARHYLIRRGHNWRNIRVLRAPPGKGSGEQYVRERYPIEVAYYWNRSSFRKAALIVVIDADTGNPEEHERELDGSLTSKSEGKRKISETIALLIPKRNVETWVLCLSGELVDEATDYKGRACIDPLIKSAAATLHEWSRDGLAVPNHCVPSLRKGLTEVRRIDQEG